MRTNDCQMIESIVGLVDDQRLKSRNRKYEHLHHLHLHASPSFHWTRVVSYRLPVWIYLWRMTERKRRLKSRSRLSMSNPSTNICRLPWDRGSRPAFSFSHLNINKSSFTKADQPFPSHNCSLYFSRHIILVENMPTNQPSICFCRWNSVKCLSGKSIKLLTQLSFFPC